MSDAKRLPGATRTAGAVGCKHAARMACWRQRRRSLHWPSAGDDTDKVTHQGCPGAVGRDSLLACDKPNACEPTALTEGAEDAGAATANALVALVCRRCAQALLPHLRLSWLRRSSVVRRSRHDHPC